MLITKLFRRSNQVNLEDSSSLNLASLRSGWRISARLAPIRSAPDVFSADAVPYLPIITDLDRPSSPLCPGRQGDGYFSGWKITRRLLQALKWAALRLRTIIIISSDRLGNRIKGREGGGRGRRWRRRSGRIHERICQPASNRSDVVVNVFTGSLTSRRETTFVLPSTLPLLFHLSRDPRLLIFLLCCSRIRCLNLGIRSSVLTMQHHAE